MGILESFTILHSPPQGFLSPLALAFIKRGDGKRVMACNPNYRSPKKLKIGKEVFIRPQEGLYVFERLTFWKRLKHWLKR
jgi:uncharacterized OB-fold protein